VIVGSLVLALAGAGGRPGHAWAQAREAQPPGPLEYVSRGDRRVIRTQVELGIRLAEEAQKALAEPVEVDELERAAALAQKSYVFLRFAMHGVELLLNQSDRKLYEGLMLKMALTSINEARARNLAAQTAIQNSIPGPQTREQYVGDARRQLGDTIPFARRAAILLR
jgi:hypothetical protein